MKTLIVEDDFTSRMMMQEMLKELGPTHIAINGREALEVIEKNLESGEPYDLVCMDIMMPEMDGQEALRKIRALEMERGIVSSEGCKIIMTTALGGMKNISTAFKNLADAYLVKPIEKSKLLEKVRELDLG